MNASIRDLRTRVDNVEVPQVDVAALVAAGDHRVGRRRAAVAAGGVAAAVLAVAIGSATLGDSSDRSQGPVDAPSSTPPSQDVRAGAVRELAYAVGSTIHYGERTIDVGGPVYFVDATDDGVVFVRGEGTKYPQPAMQELWFTDGIVIDRIGTVWGSPARGYGVRSSDAGSIVAWGKADLSGPHLADAVVFDTEAMQVLTLLPSPATVLSVHADAVYWTPEGASCEISGDIGECLRHESVMRYDVATDTTTSVTGASYEKDRRSRPRTIVGPYPGDADVPGTVFWDRLTYSRGPILGRNGTSVVGLDFDGTSELSLSEARTGQPIRLEVPAGSRGSTYELSQWLDDDTVVLFGYTAPYGGSEIADEGEILVCSLSRGSCRFGPAGSPGTHYEMPGLD